MPTNYLIGLSGALWLNSVMGHSAIYACYDVQGGQVYQDQACYSTDILEYSSKENYVSLLQTEKVLSKHEQVTRKKLKALKQKIQLQQRHQKKQNKKLIKQRKQIEQLKKKKQEQCEILKVKIRALEDRMHRGYTRRQELILNEKLALYRKQYQIKCH